MPALTERVPAEPLLKAFEVRPEALKSLPERPRDRWQAGIRRARKRGWVSIQWAQEFLEEVLGLWPYSVYDEF